MSGTFDPRKEAHLLSAYVDGELEPPDVARVEAHRVATPPSGSRQAGRETEQHGRQGVGGMGGAAARGLGY